jgi:hypothetical protein
MGTVSLVDILDEVSGKRNHKDKIELLKKHKKVYALLKVLYYNFSPEIKFLLPEGKLSPDKVVVDNGVDKSYTNLYNEQKLLYLFVEGGHPSLSQNKREMLFLQMTKGLSDPEVELLELLKDKNLTSKWKIPEKVVRDAFPGLLESDKEFWIKR